MGGLFGGDDDPAPAPAPQRSPRGVRVVRSSGTGTDNKGDTILSNAMRVGGNNDEENRGTFGNYGGGEG